MTNLTPEIFEAFQSKLKLGNRRGVHLNAVPANSRYKFDLARFSEIYKSLPERFVLDLLTMRNVNFTFSIHDKGTNQNDFFPKAESIEKKEDSIYLNDRYDDDIVEEKEPEPSEIDEEKEQILKRIATGFENLIFQNEVIQSEKGVNSLGFGFPLLVRKDMNDGQITVAPILIWSVKIKPSTQMNTWEISRVEDDPIYLNEVLVNHLQSDSGVALSPISPEMLDDGKIDKPELFSICNGILEQLKVSQDLDFILNNYAPILPVKTKATYEKMLPKRGDVFIEKSGIFSLFEVQKQNIINDYESLKKDYKPFQEINRIDFQSITAIETDPSQQNVLESLKTKSKILIQGPPGTGKSQTLTALLINALENKQKTIVVCEKQTALEVLYNALEKHELGKYCIMIKDSSSDRKIVIDSVRNTIDSTDFKKSVDVYPQSVLTEQLNGIHLSKNQINAIHNKLNQRLVSEKNWQEIVGSVLEFQSDREDLNLSLFPFSFENKEFEDISEILEKGDFLYEKFRPYYQNYFLNPKKVTDFDFYSLQQNINESFGKYKSEFAEIQKLTELYEPFYFSQRKEEFAHQLEEMNQLLNRTEVVTATIDQKSDVYNTSKTNGFFYRISSWFSSEKKNTLKIQKELQEIGQKIKSISLHSNFYQIDISSDLWKNKLECQNYREKIEQAKTEFSDKVEKDFQQVDLLAVFQKNYSNSDLEKIVQSTKNLKNTIQSNAWTNKTNFGGTFTDFKNGIQALFLQFDSYNSDLNNLLLIEYNWFSFYNSTNDFQKRCLEVLYPIQNWKNSFLYSYYNLLLQKNADKTLDFDSIHYESVLKKILYFSTSQKNFIQSYWNSDQREKVKNFETQNKDYTVANLYNKRRSANFNRLPLRQIAMKDIDLFTSFFPIIFTTPDVCCNLFEGKNFYFDNVVFDEASQLKLEDNLPALLKGKNIIIAGDEHQMPPSNYFSKVFDGNIEDEDDMENEDELILSKNAILNIESLLDFALEYNFDKNHLDFHYRSKHPYLIDFSNHAFYNSRLRPLPSLSKKKPIEFIEVNGIFHEHINEEEAEKVLEILENIQPKSDGTYPSVGIATFNITQRNFIRRKIIHKQTNPENSDFNEKIMALEEAGFFIKNLENIQGDERDIIIISTTYGKKKDGRFIQSFGPINHSKGYKLLNVIITRAKEKIYVCNSIPKEFYSNYKEASQQEGANNRRAVFYAYLSYCKAVSEENESVRTEILNELDKFGYKYFSEENSDKNKFKEQFFKALQNEISEAKIYKDYHFGGYTLDVFVEKGGKLYAFECLSKEKYQGDLAYLEDIHKEKILKKFGFEYIRIWSKDWWQNANREAKSWANKINMN